MMDNIGIPYTKRNITINEIKSWLKDVDLFDARIKLCGVLGDPMVNPDCMEIIEFLIFEKQVRNLQMSTNAGTKTESWWSSLGLLSYDANKRFVCHFSIDGVDTNFYRKNVNNDHVWRNFLEYVGSGGSAVWQFIEFDYNKHEIPKARKIAKELGVEFVVRRSWRQTADKAEFKLTGTGLDHWNTIEKKASEGDYEKSNIVCRHKIENELFITAEGLLWPCCHLHDEHVSRKTNIISKVGLENDLRKKSFWDILNSEWFQTVLEESWDKNHPLHLSRCYLSCGDHGNRHVQIQ